MLIKVDTAIATQITQEMFDNENIVLPRYCHRFRDSLYGCDINEPRIWFIPETKGVKKRLIVGDWIVDSLFSVRALTDDEFKSYAFDMGLG